MMYNRVQPSYVSSPRLAFAGIARGKKLNLTPIHQIAIEHNWVNLISPRTGASNGFGASIRICMDCRSEEKILSLKDLTEQSKGMTLAEAASVALVSMREYQQNLFANSKYSSIDGFTDHISTFYEKSVSGGDINFRTIKDYMEFERKQTPKKALRKLLRKLLLLWKQGYVCNRCDNIFTTSKLTEDHIVARALGGQSKLINLQLLCESCNFHKADRAPGYKDVSPFKYGGETCNHLITCRELIQLEANQ